MRRVYSTEFQWDNRFWQSGWFRLLGFGLAFDWSGYCRFSERVGARKVLRVGRFSVTPIGPRKRYTEAPQ